MESRVCLFRPALPARVWSSVLHVWCPFCSLVPSHPAPGVLSSPSLKLFLELSDSVVPLLTAPSLVFECVVCSGASVSRPSPTLARCTQASWASQPDVSTVLIQPTSLSSARMVLSSQPLLSVLSLAGLTSYSETPI